MIADVKGEFVGMVLGHEKNIADYFWEMDSKWKWTHLRAQLVKLVMRESALGVEIVKRWGLEVQGVGEDASWEEERSR